MQEILQLKDGHDRCLLLWRAVVEKHSADFWNISKMVNADTSRCVSGIDEVLNTSDAIPILCKFESSYATYCRKTTVIVKLRLLFCYNRTTCFFGQGF